MISSPMRVSSWVWLIARSRDPIANNCRKFLPSMEAGDPIPDAYALLLEEGEADR